MEIHCVLGHMGVKGNERADKAAKIVADLKGIQECPERFTSLAHIGRTATKRNWKEVNHWFRSRHKDRAHIQRS